MPNLPRKIRILTVDDHPLFRQGVAAVIHSLVDMEVVAEGGNGFEAVELYRKHLPDVVIMDLRMPALGGVEAISIIKSEFPEARPVRLIRFLLRMPARSRYSRSFVTQPSLA